MSLTSCIRGLYKGIFHRGPSVMTLRCQLFAEFWEHRVLNGGILRHVFPRQHSEKMKILNI